MMVGTVVSMPVSGCGESLLYSSVERVPPAVLSLPDFAHVNTKQL